MTPDQLLSELQTLTPISYSGYVTRSMPGYLKACGPLCSVGDICEIDMPDESKISPSLYAEVAGVEEDRCILVPYEQTASVPPNATVRRISHGSQAKVGDVFRGRLVDAMANPLDEAGSISGRGLYASLRRYSIANVAD